MNNNKVKINIQSDIVSGFMVFLLALPLSLGIAKASGFPPAMGVLTAMIGGLVTVWFNVSPLTIKGPAAGLITICSGAILEFGGGEQGWQIVGAAIVVAAVLQMIFALLKVGSLSDFFPHSAVHGMLSAIGIIIIAKQIPILLGDEPSMYKGEGPIELLLDVPQFITHAHWHLAIIGIIGIVIMFSAPKISFLKKIPAPMIVLLLTVPLAIFWHIRDTEPSYSLVSIGDFWGSIQPHFRTELMGQFVFWKYVFMFLFVNSLESLLTVKAIDNLDPEKRTSSFNGDLLGVGAGNLVSGILGGLPMISEVVRSTSNLSFGAKTKWSNFFHGVFLLLAMILLIPVIEMIPNAALAAMLMYAGFRLAAPSQFIHALHIGKEQLAIFLITIIVTLAEDLLLGIAAGILVKFIFHLYNGAKLKNLFSAKYHLEKKDKALFITIYESAIFSNLIGFKKVLDQAYDCEKVIVDFNHCQLVDHSFMSFIHHAQNRFESFGGNWENIGLKHLKPLSNHELATRKFDKKYKAK